jgi:hypothetical protein
VVARCWMLMIRRGIGAAWACMEQLRLALQADDPRDLHDRMWQIDTAAPELTCPRPLAGP